MSAAQRLLVQLLTLGAFVVLSSISDKIDAWFTPTKVPPKEKKEKKLKYNRLMDDEHLEEILGAKQYLIDIKVPDEVSTSGNYSNVWASFCPVKWELQKNSPNTVPRYVDVIKKSGKRCSKTEFVFDLNQLAHFTRMYDKENPDKVHSLRQSGFVFHESRCGSTLVSNMLVAADPVGHRVYSEAVVLSKAMKTNNSKLVEDVLYLLGRSSNPKEKHVFYKMKSTCIRMIQPMPEALPWIFLYRDPEAVLASHFNPSETSNVVCLQSEGHPHTSELEIAKEHNRTYKSLSDAEVCAVRMASLSRAAIQAHDRTGGGMFYNYNTLPSKFWETILPDQFGVDVSADKLERMMAISGTYSKAGKKKNQAEWLEEDMSKKLSKVTAEQKKAALEFLHPFYGAMERISLEQEALS